MDAELLIDLERPADGVALLTLDRPAKRNALSVELRELGCRLLAELADDESIRTLVVAGSGPAFCSGFDLDEFTIAATDPEFGRRLWASSDEWHRRWIEFPLPTVAAVDGPALAGGFDIAVMCDLRVVSRAATFGHPEVSFGQVVYGPLHDLVGGAVARDLCFTGRRVDATEAHRLGLVSRLVAPGEARTAALALAVEIAAAPRASLLGVKAKAVRRAGTVRDGTLDL